MVVFAASMEFGPREVYVPQTPASMRAAASAPKSAEKRQT